MKKWCLLVGLAGAMSIPGAADAAELIVLSAAAVRDAVLEVSPRFQAATGHSIRFVFGTAGKTQERVAAGEPVDLVILPPPRLRELAAGGSIAAEQVALGLSRLGVAVKAGAPHPPLVSVDDFRRALLAAPSIGFANAATGATTGIYFAKLMQEMGLSESLKPTIRLYPDGFGAIEAAAAGEVAIAAAPISEIVGVRGAELVAPLPDAIQQKTVYAAALGGKPREPEIARALFAMLGSPEAAALFTAHGFDKP